MSRAIRFRNNTYLASSGVIYNRRTLATILDASYIAIQETEYLSNNLYYIRIGKIIIVPIDEWAITKEFKNGDILLRGLPKSNKYVRFTLRQFDNANIVRMAVDR